MSDPFEAKQAFRDQAEADFVAGCEGHMMGVPPIGSEHLIAGYQWARLRWLDIHDIASRWRRLGWQDVMFGRRRRQVWALVSYASEREYAAGWKIGVKDLSEAVRAYMEEL